MPVHNSLVHARLVLALVGPFCLLLPCIALPNFWNNAHSAPAVWPRVGVNDAQMCPLRFGARMFLF